MSSDKEEGLECYESDCECKQEDDELIGECSFCNRSVCEDHSFMLHEKGNDLVCNFCASEEHDEVDKGTNDKEEGLECYESDCECRQEDDELIGECSFCSRSVCEDHSFMLHEKGNDLMCLVCGEVDEFVDDKEDGLECLASDCDCRDENDELIGECSYCRRSVCEDHAFMLHEPGLYCNRDHCRNMYEKAKSSYVDFSDDNNDNNDDDNNNDDDDDSFLRGDGISTMSLGSALPASKGGSNDKQKEEDDEKEDLLKCRDCGEAFLLTDDERERNRSRNVPLPARCAKHRGKKNKKNKTMTSVGTTPDDALPCKSESTGTAVLKTPDQKKKGAKNKTPSSQKKRRPLKVFCYGGKGCGNEINYTLDPSSDFPARCSIFKGSHKCNWSHILCANCRRVISDYDLEETLRTWVCAETGCQLHGGIMTHYNLILH